MSDQFHSKPLTARSASGCVRSSNASTPLTSIRSMLSRWVFSGARLAPVTTEGRRPGAAKPVYVEVSPAMVDPFPEPRTIPGGWDLSELVKGK